MKAKRLISFLSLSLVALLCACQMEEMDRVLQPEAREVIITAEMEAPSSATRTETELTMENGNKTFPMYWLPNDRIMIYSAGESSVFRNIYTERTRIAKFKGTISGITGADDGSARDYVWGFYPSSLVQGYTEPDGISETAVLTAELPSSQSSKAESYATNLALMVGRAESTAIFFKSIYSCIYFTFDREDIISVSFKGVNDEVLAGKIEVTMDASGNPVHTPVVGETASEVMLMAPTGSTFAKDTKYYMILLPRLLSSGFTVTLRTQDGQEGSFTSSSSLSLNRNGFRQLATPDKRISKPEDYPNTTSTGWHQAATQGLNEIWYTSIDDMEVEYSGSGNVESIPPSAENGHVGIIRFPNALTAIPAYAFNNESARDYLKTVTLPEGLQTIGTYAFLSCHELEEVNMGDQVTYIYDGAFVGCNFRTIRLSESLVRIGSECFAQNTALETITIPESVRTLGGNYYFYYNPFYGCSSLREFKGKFATPDGKALLYGTTEDARDQLISFAPASVPEGGTYRIPDGVKGVAPMAFRWAKIGEVDLNGVVQIWEDAFFNCEITTVTLPSSVVAVQDNAFAACRNLTSIYIEASKLPTGYDGMFDGSTCPIYVPAAWLEVYRTSNKWSAYADRYVAAAMPNEILYTTTDGSALAGYTTDSTTGNVVSEIVAPGDNNGVGVIRFTQPLTVIDERALIGNAKLETVTLPSGVTEIQPQAFFNCRNLQSVKLNQGLQSIDLAAFGHCVSLISITLPEGLSVLGSQCFTGCVNLSSVSIPAGVTFESNPFTACTSLGYFSGTNETIAEGGTCLILDGTLISVALGCITDGSYSIPSGITTIGSRAFALAPLTSITVPEGITTLDAYAFGLSSLTAIDLPASLTAIGDDALSSCESLASITMRGITPPTLGNRVFWGLPSDIKIWLPGAGGLYYPGADIWQEYQDYFCYYQADDEVWYHLSDDTGDQITNPLGLEATCNGIIISDPSQIAPNVAIPESMANPTVFMVWRRSDGAPVTSITDNAFSQSSYYVSRIDYVSLPKTIQQIGENAFNGCTALAAFPVRDASGVNIGAYAFKDCTNMTLPEYNGNASDPKPVGWTSTFGTVGDQAFYNAGILKVRLEGLTELGEKAFMYCNNLVEATLGPVTELKTSTFEFCQKLEAVRLTDESSVTAIGNRVFFRTNKLKYVCSPGSSTVNLPELLTIGTDGFYETNISEMTLPKLTTIGTGGISYNSALTSLDIRHVTGIGDGGLEYNPGLTTLYLLSLENMLNSVFRNDTGLTTLWIGPNLSMISGGRIFAGIPSGQLDLFLQREATTTADVPYIQNNTLSDANGNYFVFKNIHVRSNSESSYKAGRYWSNFADKILGDAETYPWPSLD